MAISFQQCPESWILNRGAEHSLRKKGHNLKMRKNYPAVKMLDLRSACEQHIGVFFSTLLLADNQLPNGNRLAKRAQCLEHRTSRP